MLTLLAIASVLGPQSTPGSRIAPPLAFGVSVALSEGTLFVGRPGLVPGFPMPAMEVGSVHLFRANAAGQWLEVGRVAARDGLIGDGFGLAVSVDGNTLAVGAPAAGSERGAVYVFERTSAGAWVERAKLTTTSGAPGDRFGGALAVSGGGGSLFVGAPGRDSSRGEVRVFERDARTGSWGERASLSGELARPGDRFGASIALASGGALVGAPGPAAGGFLGGNDPPKPGVVYAFRRAAGGPWQPDGRLESGDTTAAALGTSLALDGADAYAGSPLAAGFAGRVLHFRRAGDGAWSLVARLAPDSAEVPGGFGSAIARDGGDLLIGAPFAGQGIGALFVLRREAAGGAWRQHARLTVQAVGLGVGFGGAIAARAGLAAVGAPQADFFEGIGYLYRRESATGPWVSVASVVDSNPGLPVVKGSERRCDSSAVAGFPCESVDLVSFLPLKALGGKRGIMLNDLWGWTDPETSREFAIVGRLDGTAFIEVTDPANPVYLGELPLHAGARPNLWRDMKVYKNHAYIVSDGAGPHGMQVFDLTQLRQVSGAPRVFSETAHYDRIHSAHNIVIDTTAGFAYTVGNSMGGQTCGGALHMIDIRNPAVPSFAGCYSDPATGRARTGYTHDSQCVVYHGPDTRYSGRQICFNASETAVGIADVTDKSQPKALSSASYPNVGYTHQGWLSDDQRYFFLDDELDELAGTAPRTRTVVWDVSNLEDPVVLTEFLGNTSASDHNQYVKGRYLYQSNYVAGLRVLDIQDPKNPVEVGFFDTVPYGLNAPGFAGSWSNYPYFKSGVVAVTSMREGFFLVRFRPRTPIP